MTSALLDPWLTTAPTSPEEEFRKFAALLAFTTKVRTVQPLLDVAGFLDAAESESLKAWVYDARKPSRGVATWFFPLRDKLTRRTDGCRVAAVVDGPPDLTSSWLEVLWELTDPADATAWRSPILLVPLARDAAWPAATYATVDVRGSETQRLLVRIEAAESHAHFRHALDPWLHRDPTTPAGLTEAETKCLMRLPRPPQLSPALAIHAWASALADVDATYPSAAGRFYPYIPDPKQWKPHAMTRDDWQRGAGCFPVGAKESVKGEKKGPVDRNGAVWCWDIEERHWDVQHPDVRRPAAYANVSTVGLVLKVVE